MAKQTYRYCNEQKRFITAEDWEKKYGKMEYYNKGSPHIIRDIDSPFLSQVDGSVIASNKQLREHNKRNGVTNIGDYSEDFFKKKSKDIAKKARGETDKDSLDRKKTLDEVLTKKGVK